ncbi:MAG: hypothetical protein H6566_24295 [Lewinellaceae bacterium]|nr:hypothetical protein [Lewinellaceae bacterium]
MATTIVLSFLRRKVKTKGIGRQCGLSWPANDFYQVRKVKGDLLDPL